MVVGIHTNFLINISLLASWLTINGIFRIAVPLFLIINGFYFYTVISKGTTRQWIKRIILLYLFWMLFYSYFWFRPTEFSLLELRELIIQFIIGYAHLWYIPGMLGAGLLVHFLNSKSWKLILSSIFITFLIGVILQYISGYIHPFDNYWIYRNFLFFAFPFFFIGFLINKYDIHNRIPLKISVISSLIGLGLLILESYINYIYSLDNVSFDNLFSLLLICPAIFILFMNIKIYGNTDNKYIALYATGVYFSHMFILQILVKYSNLEGTLLTFVTFIFSMIASYFFIKVKETKIKFIL